MCVCVCVRVGVSMVSRTSRPMLIQFMHVHLEDHHVQPVEVAGQHVGLTIHFAFVVPSVSYNPYQAPCPSSTERATETLQN